MSDEPLFQTTDAQEQTYAPEQRPPGDPTRRTPTDELSDAGATTSARETGTGDSVTGTTNRELNDASGQTPSG